MTSQHIEATAVGQGYYRVFVDGQQTSQHIAEREALEAAGKRKRDKPEAVVYYDHDYHVRVDLVNAPVVVPPIVEPEPEPEPPIVVVPPVDPGPIDPPPSGKKLLQSYMLKPVGGFRFVSNSAIGGFATKYASGSFDIHPQTGRWAISHRLAVVDCSEPGPMGLIDQPLSSWPALTIERHQRILGDDAEIGSNRITPEGVVWIGEDTILGTGQRGYRGPYNPEWAASVNLTTGEETRYTFATHEENLSTYGYDPQLAFASGFARKPGSPSGSVMMAAGGYNTLGSQYGPTMAEWNIGDQFVNPIITHPTPEQAAIRDSAYDYPSPERGGLGIWRLPDGFTGYWQGVGSSRGAAWIDHPEVKGIIYASTHGRGYLDYRSQGATGGGPAAFTLRDPLAFYTHRGYGAGRGGAGFEYWNADGPKGIAGRLLTTFDPDDLSESVFSNIDLSFLPLVEQGKEQTKIGGVGWDSRRGLLWISLMFLDGAGYALVAFEIDADAEPTDTMKTPESWHLDATGKLSPINPIGLSRNGLTAAVMDGGVSLSWDESTLDSHADWQVMRSAEERSGWEVIATVSETQWTDAAPIAKAYYLVVDRANAAAGVEVHDIRGKVFV